MANLNLGHGLVAMFLEMAASDGHLDKAELQQVGGRAARHLKGPFGDDTPKIIEEGCNWFDSFINEDDTDWHKKRTMAIFTLGGQMVSAIPKESRVQVIHDLAAIANADGKVEDIEKSFFFACMECLEITKEDLG
tara:strand:- start:474 stop:878 length:405 start_codon:yes stop_codon:yes gene_type:complete